MPDIKTAMENALKSTINSWAEDDKPLNQPVNQTTLKEKTMANPNPIVNIAKQPNGRVLFAPTVGVSRAVFDAVHDNPGIPRQQLVDSLVAKGFKKSSVASLVTQNILGQVFKIDGHNRLTTAVKEYTAPPNAKKREALRRVKPIKATKPAAPKAVAPKTAGIAALKVDTGVLGVSVFDLKEFLNTLSIMQARELYDALRKVFGG